jgi:hypothetical protein
VSLQTVNKGLGGGGSEQVAKQQLSYFGNDDLMELTHTVGASGANANAKTYGFAYDARHQLVDVDVQQSALGLAPFVAGGQAYSAEYSFGQDGRLAAVNVPEPVARFAVNDIAARNVKYCYDGTQKEQLNALRTTSNADACVGGSVFATYGWDAAGNQTTRDYPTGD